MPSTPNRILAVSSASSSPSQSNTILALPPGRAAASAVQTEHDGVLALPPGKTGARIACRILKLRS